MKQKLKDYLLLIKNDRKIQLITIVVLLLVGSFIFTSPKKRTPPAPSKDAIEIGPGTTASRESAEDILTAFGERIDTIDTRLDEGQKRDGDIQKQLSEFEERSGDILAKMLERLTEIDLAVGQSQSEEVSVKPLELGEDQVIADISSPDAAVDELEPFGLEPRAPEPPPEPPRPAKAFIGAGDSMKARLLAGVNAPTSGSPYPVMFEALGPIAGPDGTLLPIGGARIIGAATGNLVDGRALFRITELGLRLPNGERKQVKVDGWVVGEDGIRGLPGRLVDHLGEQLAISTLTGALDGLASGIAASNTTTIDNGDSQNTFISGDVGEVAAAGAAKGVTNQYSKIIEQRAAQLIPYVEVLPGREVTILFAKSTTIDDLLDLYGEEEYFDPALD